MKRVLHSIPCPPVLFWIVVLCILIELALQGADLGLWGTPIWRGLAYGYGAFWPGLLSNWKPNFSAQPWLMFVTYAFLHGGFVHLVVNMITLISLGAAVITRVGRLRFMLIYAGSTVLGAAAFALMTNSGVRPMVGASGALFGLAGALVAFNTIQTIRDRPGILLITLTILWPVGILVGLNVLMYMGTDGGVAWETHLGGFVTGVALAAVMPPQEDASEL